MKFCIFFLIGAFAPVYSYAQLSDSEDWASLHSQGIQEYFKENYKQSLLLFTKAKNLMERKQGRNHPDYARSCNSLGNVYFAMRLYGKALLSYNEALELREKVIGKQTRDYAITAYNLARLYRITGDFTKAEILLLDAERILLKVKGRNDLEYSDCLIGLSIVYRNFNDTIKSERYLKEALDIKSGFIWSDSVEFGNQLYNIGIFYKEAALYDRAEFFLTRAKNLRASSPGRLSPQYQYTIYHLAELYSFKRKYEQSEILYLELISAWKVIKGDSSSEYAYALSNLGGLYKNMEMYEKASEYYTRALAVKTAIFGEESIEVAENLEFISDLNYRMGDYGAAEREILKAYKIVRQHGDSSNIMGNIINDLGSLYLNLGVYEKAEEYFIQAQSLWMNVNGKKSFYYVGSLNNLAMVYQSNGNYKVADKLYETAIEIANQSLPHDIDLKLGLINNRGTLYDDRGFLVEAEKYYTQVKDIQSRHDKNTVIYAQACANLANVYFLNGREDESVQLVLEAISILKNIYNENHPQYIDLLSNLALAYYDMGDYEKAFSNYKELNKKVFNQIQRYFPHLSGKERENFYQVIQKRFEFYNSLVLLREEEYKEGVGELYNNQLIIKGLLFNSDNRIRDRVLASGNDSLKMKYQEWKNLRNQLAKAYKTYREVDASKKLEAEINSLEKDLASQLGLSQNENQTRIYSWKDIQKSLSKNEAAVELIRFRTYGTHRIVTDSSDSKLPQYIFKGKTDTVYYAALIVVKGVDQPVAVVLRNGNELENKFVRNYRNQIRFKLLDTISYSRYWKPVQDAIVKLNKRIKTIYVSPDGVYNLINLRTLYDPEKQNFLADKVTLQTVVNPGDLTGNKSVKKISYEAYRAVLFGYPDFTLNDEEDSTTTNTEADRSIEVTGIQRFFGDGKISDLPGTKVEVQRIDQMLKQKGVTTSAYTHSHATEDILKQINRQQLLHVATHGFFLEDLSTQSEFAGFDSKTILKNPLLRSGLLLSGSQNAFTGRTINDKEDGILTAYEAMNLNLDGTELVVLSACETGLGEIRNGEGVYGLQRAFQTAGAKSVLMSLWKVDDTATQELMTLFYKNWLKSGDKRLAFNNAQTAIRSKYKHPYYWGAFVLVGE